MTAKRTRHNGEGSIFPIKKGSRLTSRAVTPAGTGQRKWVYGKARESVHEKYLDLHRAARGGPAVTRSSMLPGFMDSWLGDGV